MLTLQSLFGLVVIVGLSWLLSENRPLIPWRLVLIGFGLQLLLAVTLIKFPYTQSFFTILNQIVLTLDQATTAGTSFAFGYLGGGDAPFELIEPSRSFIFAFKALPLIIVVSALSALLFYWRVLPWIVNKLARFLSRTMGISGSLGLGAALNIFVGMIEAPLFIRPYLAKLSRAEMFALMTTGMATIAGTMMVLYATILSEIREDALGQVLSASVISIPAALVIAMILIPEKSKNKSQKVGIQSEANSAMDAITRGTLDGVKLLINIVAMLIVFVALVALINILLSMLPAVNGEPITLQGILGYIFTPLVWLMGIPTDEVLVAGSLMGIKTILNELLAYLQLAALPEDSLSARSELIMIYALCGFANFGSLGIMLGGIGTMVPERRAEIARLGLKSILAGTLATMMTGAFVGVLV